MDSYPHAVAGFLAAMDADPSDFLARCVLADWLDENGHESRAAMWRLTAEKRVYPVFVDEDVRSKIIARNIPSCFHNHWLGLWHWVQAGTDGVGWAWSPLYWCAISDLPTCHVGASSVALLISLVELLNTSSSALRRFRQLPTKEKKST